MPKAAPVINRPSRYKVSAERKVAPAPALIFHTGICTEACPQFRDGIWNRLVADAAASNPASLQSQAGFEKRERDPSDNAAEQPPNAALTGFVSSHASNIVLHKAMIMITIWVIILLLQKSNRVFFQYSGAAFVSHRYQIQSSWHQMAIPVLTIPKKIGRCSCCAIADRTNNPAPNIIYLDCKLIIRRFHHMHGDTRQIASASGPYSTVLQGKMKCGHSLFRTAICKSSR